MVAEKPSLAQSIARLLAASGDVESRRGTLDVHEWTGQFKGRPARFRMTSVIGHVYSIDFPARYNDWERTDPESLFDAETQKTEANPKVCAHMKQGLVVWCCKPNPCSQPEQGCAFKGWGLVAGREASHRRAFATICSVRPRVATILSFGWTATARARTFASKVGRRRPRSLPPPCACLVRGMLRQVGQVADEYVFIHGHPSDGQLRQAAAASGRAHAASVPRPLLRHQRTGAQRRDAQSGGGCCCLVLLCCHTCDALQTTREKYDGPSSNMGPIHCGKKADVATCPVRVCSFTCSLGIHV